MHIDTIRYIFQLSYPIQLEYEKNSDYNFIAWKLLERMDYSGIIWSYLKAICYKIYIMLILKSEPRLSRIKRKVRYNNIIFDYSKSNG
jgi:hypothetical protein